MRPAQRGKSSCEAGNQVNVSSRLVQYAVKVLQSGCAELIAAVESGALAVSTASALASLTHEEQKQVVAGGAKEAARKVREMRGEKTGAEPVDIAGRFGVVRGKRGKDGVVFLWVAPTMLTTAIKALEAGGLHFAPSM